VIAEKLIRGHLNRVQEGRFYFGRGFILRVCHKLNYQVYVVGPPTYPHPPTPPSTRNRSRLVLSNPLRFHPSEKFLLFPFPPSLRLLRASLERFAGMVTVDRAVVCNRKMQERSIWINVSASKTKYQVKDTPFIGYSSGRLRREFDKHTQFQNREFPLGRQRFLILGFLGSFSVF
jgi:hypothetical protein